MLLCGGENRVENTALEVCLGKKQSYAPVTLATLFMRDDSEVEKYYFKDLWKVVMEVDVDQHPGWMMWNGGVCVTGYVMQ